MQASTFSSATALNPVNDVLVKYILKQNTGGPSFDESKQYDNRAQPCTDTALLKAFNVKYPPSLTGTSVSYAADKYYLSGLTVPNVLTGGETALHVVVEIAYQIPGAIWTDAQLDKALHHL